LDGKGLAVTEKAMAGQIDLHPAEVDRGQWGVGDGLGLRLLCSAQERPDAGEELSEAERLCHVVVRAELEPDDLVDLRALRRQHENRHARFGSNDPADLEAGQLWEHEV